MGLGRDFGAELDARGLTPLQWRVLALCTAVVLLDGFDVQAIAFTGPAIAAQWDLAPGRLGPVFAAGLVGMAAGALVVGPLGDRFGRRPALLLSVVTFGLFTLLTAFARDFTDLVVLRILTGLGLGGALPNATALMTEYAPLRRRALAVAVIFLGIPLGGMAGGLLAQVLIPAYGWPSVFVLGGLAPLLLLPVLWWGLPESVRYLLMIPERTAQVARLLRALRLPGEPAEYLAAQAVPSGLPVARLFRGGLAADTLKLWAAFGFNLTTVYFLINWIPSLLVQAGFELGRATQASVLLNVGGAVGPLLLAAAAVRYGTRAVLAAAFVAGALATAALGQVGDRLALVMSLTFAAGFFTFGAQISMNTLAAAVYTTDARATGVGWALGIGRLGSILGPVIGGTLVGLGLGMPVYFGLFGALLLVAGASSVLVRRHQPGTRAPATVPP